MAGGQRWAWLKPSQPAATTQIRCRSRVEPSRPGVARPIPALIARQAPGLGVWAVWVHHGLITARLITAARAVGVAVIAWTVDDPARVAELAAVGVDGICSNDPRLLVPVGSP